MAFYSRISGLYFKAHKIDFYFLIEQFSNFNLYDLLSNLVELIFFHWDLNIKFDKF
jgi:hypothetical protein